MPKMLNLRKRCTASRACRKRGRFTGDDKLLGRGDSLKFEIKTVEIADNAAQTRIFIDGIDVTNRIKKFTLKKDSSPLELSLTILGDIDVSIDSFEMGNIKNIDLTQSEYQYTAKEKTRSEPRQKRLLRRLKDKSDRCF